MKNLSLILSCVIMLLACNNSETKVSPSVDTATATTESENVSLPYTVEKTPDWIPGSMTNVAIAMQALKAYETNDSAGLAANFADSVSFYHDNGSIQGTKDSVARYIQSHRNNLNNVSVTMRDYESVKSKSRNEEWVSLWYTETTTDKKGKTDSMMTMDDIKIVNQKISIIDTKSRRLARKN